MMLLPYPPSLNRYLRHTGRTYKTPEALKYKTTVSTAGALARMKPLSGPVAVQLVLHPKTTKQGAASATRIDLDNAMKVCLDALQGIAYHDDNQVEEIHARIGEPVLTGGLSVAVFSMGQGPASPVVRFVSEQPAPPIFSDAMKDTK